LRQHPRFCLEATRTAPPITRRIETLLTAIDALVPGAG